MKKYIVLALIVNFLNACSEKNEISSFFNIQRLDKNLQDQIQISVFTYKKELDLIGKDVYDTIVHNHLVENNDDYLFKKFGQVKINGASLNSSESKEKGRFLIKLLWENINMDNCVDKSKDSICEAKAYFKNWLKEDLITIYSFNETIEKLYRNKYLNQEEYNFMIIYGFVLNSVMYQSKK